MDYIIGHRTTRKLKFFGFVDTYCGGNTNYYGVRAYFKDEKDNSLFWDTTFKGKGLLSELAMGEVYDLRFTVDAKDDNRFSIKRVIR